MSFTTRCPACGTTFKVVPDQLKISDGWVRCGHCADVFDATLFLQGAQVPVAPASPSRSPQPPVFEGVPRPRLKAAVETAPPAVSAATEDSDGDGDWLVRPLSTSGSTRDIPLPIRSSNDKGIDKEETELAQGAFLSELRQFSQSRPAELRDIPPSKVSLAPAAKVATGAVSEPRGAEEGYEPPSSQERIPQVTEDELALPAEPGFVLQARRRAFWRSRGMRSALWVASLLLALGLVAQYAVYKRDHLAARFPAATPMLETLCLPAGCKIGPVRQIESVVIDSSNLVRRLGNFYSFDFVLKNSAGTPVAVPALELSLTDTRDAVIVRRVFLPGELPGAPQLLPAQGSLSLSLRLSIAEQGVSAMSGYRALVFYP
jgi:predicted Zn finger-like uncharacterized protein